MPPVTPRAEALLADVERQNLRPAHDHLLPRILAKINARDRAQAVVLAYQSRLMESPDPGR